MSLETSTAVRSFFIPGPAGRLEALLNTGAADAGYAAVVCHPHPLFGGTMHNKVVFAAMKALNGFGFPVLRFNFRGAGRSAGSHDQGRGEIDDVRAALAWLHGEFGRPVIFAGFSFGAGVGLRAAVEHPQVAAMIAIGLPITVEERPYDYAFLQSATVPKLFVSGDDDQFAWPDDLRRLVDGLPEPKQLTLIEDADHFFEPNHLPELRQVIADWISNFLLPGR